MTPAEVETALERARAELLAADATLAAIVTDRESQSVRIGRARAMIVGARQQLAAAIACETPFEAVQA